MSREQDSIGVILGAAVQGLLNAGASYDDIRASVDRAVKDVSPEALAPESAGMDEATSQRTDRMARNLVRLIDGPGSPFIEGRGFIIEAKNLVHFTVTDNDGQEYLVLVVPN